MQKTAKGQITLVSLADGSSTIFFITPNQSTQQIYLEDSGVYTPDYTQSNLTLTPNIKVGSVTPSNITYSWKKGVTPINSGYNQNTGVLTISSNINGSQEVYTCDVMFDDPSSGAPCTAQSQVVLSKITSGGSTVTTFLEPTTAENIATTKKNYIDQDTDAVALGAQVYYGASQKSNSQTDTAIVYRWSIWNSTKNNFVGFDDDYAIESGITSANSASTETSPIYFKRDFTNAYGFVRNQDPSDPWDVKIYGNYIILKRDAIDVKETIRCEAEYFDRTGSVRGNSHGADADIETIRDLTDPYQCTITSTSLALTSNVTEVLLTANLVQNGQDVTSRVNPTYDWDAYSIATEPGELDKPWPEYTTDGSIWTRMSGNETGAGYWVVGGSVGQSDANGPIDITAPVHTQITNTRQVTVYRSQVGPASNIECTLNW